MPGSKERDKLVLQRTVRDSVVFHMYALFFLWLVVERGTICNTLVIETYQHYFRSTNTEQQQRITNNTAVSAVAHVNSVKTKKTPRRFRIYHLS